MSDCFHDSIRAFGGTFHIEAPTGFDAAWLRSHASHQPGPAEGILEPMEVSIRPGLYRGTLPREPTAWVRDYGDACYARWRLANGDLLRMAGDPSIGSLTHDVFLGPDKLELWIPEEGYNRAAQVLLRVLRSLGRGLLLERGGVLVHSSFVSVGDSGLLCVARSGGGKTSTALRLCQKGGSLVSTDRTLLLPAAGRWLGVGGPDPVRVGIGAAQALGITDQSARHSVRPQPAVDQIALASANPDVDVKYELTLGDAEEILGIPTQESAKLGAVLFLERGSPAIRECTPKEAIERVGSEVLHPEPREGFLLAQGILSAEEARQKLSRALASVPAYVVAWEVDRLDALSYVMDLV